MQHIIFLSKISFLEDMDSSCKGDTDLPGSLENPLKLLRSLIGHIYFRQVEILAHKTECWPQ